MLTACSGSLGLVSILKRAEARQGLSILFIGTGQFPTGLFQGSLSVILWKVRSLALDSQTARGLPQTFVPSMFLAITGMMPFMILRLDFICLQAESSN